MLCQRCGKSNEADRERCRSCGAPLYVVGTERNGESAGMQPFLGLEDYLMDKLSSVEKQASRHSEDVNLLVHAVDFMERNVMVNQAGIHVLAAMLREKGLIEGQAFGRRWREHALENLSALHCKERFLDARPDILGSFGGKNRRRFDERLARAEDLFSGLQPHGACQSLEEALALDPRNVPLLAVLGDVMGELGHHEKAAGLLEKVIGEKHPPEAAVLAWARAKLRLGGDPRIEDKLAHLAEADSGRHEAWTLLALAHALSGRWSPCLACADKSFHMEETPAACYIGAHALVRIGRLAAAHRKLEQAESLAPDWDAPPLQRAMLLMVRGWWARAAEALGRVEALSPGFDGSGLLKRFRAASPSRRRALAALPLDPARVLDMMNPAAEEAGMYLQQVNVGD